MQGGSLVRHSLSSCGGLLRAAVQRLEGLGLGQLRRANYRRPGRYLLGGGVISAAVTKEGIRAEEASGYDWASNRPNAAAFAQFHRDIEEAHRLTRDTLVCKECGLRLRIDGELAEVVYCQCPDSPKSVYGVEGADGWRPFLEKRDLLVWRRPHSLNPGMYEYKMYGSFADVTAEEFLFVQNDLSKFRLSWDSSTKSASVIAAEDTSSLVYYWQVSWPRFFSNRDYCCLRSVDTDPESGTTTCVSQSTRHLDCEEVKGVVRVSDYHSVLTVRPHSSIELPGTEFCLTGFENPGVALPEAIVTWVAIRGMPEFMVSLRAACLRFRKEREGGRRWGIQEDNFGQITQRRQRAFA